VLAVSGGDSAPTPGQLVSSDGPNADRDDAEAA
jgi:hypothetical protein